MKLLFIGAHPADLIDLAAGTIANHVRAGDGVYILAMTSGLYAHRLTKQQRENKNIKTEELYNALAMINPDIVATALDYGDGISCGHDDFLEPIMNRIGIIKPDVVITHHPMESHHPDHAKVGAATMEAIVQASRYMLVHSLHTVSNIFFYGYQFHPNMVKLGKSVVPPDVVVDITEVIEIKAKAFMELKTQFNTEKVVWARLNSMEKECGRQYGFEYAETFISYQPCRTTLLPDFGDSNFQKLLRKQVGEEQIDRDIQYPEFDVVKEGL